MHRVVIDTKVLVSALRSRRGASFRLIGMLGDSRWQPVVSVPLILEHEEVAKREAARLGLAESAVDAILDAFCQVGQRQVVRFRVRPVLTDPDDEFVLELAVASQSRISGNVQPPGLSRE
jgi:putative PIN family toxin of toxin-antitoxin system